MLLFAVNLDDLSKFIGVCSVAGDVEFVRDDGSLKGVILQKIPKPTNKAKHRILTGANWNKCSRYVEDCHRHFIAGPVISRLLRFTAFIMLVN